MKNNSIELPLSFGETFLDHHAGQIIQDPKYAVVELVANSWDAGASLVEIKWPELAGQEISFYDNGTGMTREEFSFRWIKLNYNRLIDQSKEVKYPKGRGGRQRIAFGKNGIGRHGMFCFCNEYTIETKKDGQLTKALVVKTPNEEFPYKVIIQDHQTGIQGNGTIIRGIAIKNVDLPSSSVTKIIGSKFIADPEFIISVNAEKVTFEHLEEGSIIGELKVGDNVVVIKRFEGEKNRTTQQQGVAWWVFRRLVGFPSWDGISGRLIDGRNPIAKRFVYIVEADFLKTFIKADWSGFNSNSIINETKQIVYDFINEDLISLLSETRKERKHDAFVINKDIINSLPEHLQEDLSEIIDAVQLDCPTFGINELESTVKVLAQMEKSRSGYSLLEKLSNFNDSDIDSLNAVLDEWSINDIKKVMNELKWRLDLISKLEPLVENTSADELHDLQPLFERGLWIFGPEFESISFSSNRTLSTVVKLHFGNKELINPAKRPDFIVLPDSSIGIYSSDSFDETHNIDGLDSVIIVELKRGGFEIGYIEKDQAMGYARAIRGSGKVDDRTKITCYVLGARIDSSAGIASTQHEGNTQVIPRRYSSVLKQAHARTFNLLSKLENSNQVLNNKESKTADLFNQKS